MVFIIKSSLNVFSVHLVTRLIVGRHSGTIYTIALCPGPEGGGRRAWYLLHMYARTTPRKPGVPQTTVYFFALIPQPRVWGYIDNMTSPCTLGHGRRAKKRTVIRGIPGFLGVVRTRVCNRYQALSPPPQRPGYKATFAYVQNAWRAQYVKITTGMWYINRLHMKMLEYYTLRAINWTVSWTLRWSAIAFGDTYTLECLLSHGLQITVRFWSCPSVTL